MGDLTQISGRGTVTLPVDLRRRLGLSEGDVLTVRLENGSIVLTPAVVSEVERYTDERLEEFERSSELTPEEIRRVRKNWKLPLPRG
jgi:AbrB family looped-hinge helix DNA binding protein